MLGHDLCTTGLQQTAQRVPKRRPAGVPQVQRACGVGRNELEVDDLADEFLVVTVGSAGVDDRLGQSTGACGLQRDVDEPRPGYLGQRDTVHLAEPASKDVGYLASRHTGRFGQLQSHVR